MRPAASPARRVATTRSILAGAAFALAFASAPLAAQGLGIAPADTSAVADDDTKLILAEGQYECELKNKVIVRRIAQDGKSLTLNWRGKDHELTAVESRAGALRYESDSVGLAWITIVGKSFLLDTKKGQRIAAECKL